MDAASDVSWTFYSSTLMNITEPASGTNNDAK